MYFILSSQLTTALWKIFIDANKQITEFSTTQKRQPYYNQSH